jgi:hypothetical protein
MSAQSSPEPDVALVCLRQLAAVSRELHASASQVLGSVDKAEWTEGLTYRQIMPLRRRLDMIERISTALRELTSNGHLFRRAEARALYAEGLTMAQLATVFGVSRQRVSVLLRDDA